MPDPDLISSREAETWLGLARRQARRVLTAGLAGPPVVTPSAHLYRAADVGDLSRWPRVALEEGWDLSVWTRLWIRIVCERDGWLPFVATVGGFVALGAEITAVAQTSPRRCRLELRDPGAWFETLRSTRFPTGPGRDWVLRGSPCSSRGSSEGPSMGEWQP
ncbi:hypothetical protein NSZ01_23570 [Nocardioides szechwanensis]|uniref:Uncharacterized protein n=1 Tax=Nocardioides szechwanensis TaxID=1005944 RepID=A0A1H0EQS0_9ACTN|nr:hypothetical protein [Nocardioides szechwanensis]GEP34589.1 hypothetical protein NSZ01_23570 [Nocardioides szechwanensis]SDN84711.1 hypothetical protein SAMN05192576_2944 [Nocardioides szechwanensis]